jgi:predicted TIM-barrel fold metal-dependent hydrolase
LKTARDWVPHLFHTLRLTYKKMPHAFAEDPIETFKRCVYISPFWEDNFVDIVKMVGTDRVVFGSDWPHPEGLKDPISFVDDLSELSPDDQALIMGGNMMKLFKVAQPVSA